MDAQPDCPQSQPYFRATGDILRMMRRARGISQGELVTILQTRYSRKCCVSQVSRYERGNQRLPAETAYLCCEIYAYHPVTFTLCLLKNDRRWWRIMLSLDPGRFVETILMSTYNAYGARMDLLEDENFNVASSMVLTLFDTRLAPRRRPKNHPFKA